ncbi:MAG: GNAT family N-acetyltransferase [Coprobacillus sp.]
MKTRKATINDIPILKDLWYENFLEHDSKESIDYYFENNLDIEHTFILEDDNEVITSLQLNQHQLVIDKKIEEVSFVVGVATFKKYHRQGYMRILLNDAIEYVRSTMKQKYIILQAYNWDVYRSFGFVDAYYKQVLVYDIDSLKDIEDVMLIDYLPNKMLEQYNEYVENLNGYKKRGLVYFKNIEAMSKVEELHIALSEKSYIVYGIDNNKMYVGDCAYSNEIELLKLIKKELVRLNLEQVQIETDIHHKFKKESKQKLNMMILNLVDDKLEEKSCLYISEEI